MSATLALVATALETAAGASTSTNSNEAGYWKRIAAAAESLAGATTSANDVPSGYMLRSALALESIAGTSGAEENSNYSGLLKRIVDALEVQSGAVEVGSLEYRLLLGAQNAVFGSGEELGPEMSTAAGGGNWTGAGWVENEALNRLSTNSPGGAVTNVTGTAPQTGHLYRVEWELISLGGGFGTGVSARIGGTAGTARATPGIYTEDIVASNTSKPSFFCDDEDGCVIGARSFKEVL